MNQRTEEKIEYGYCKCGCGQKTNISKINSPKNGRFKGKPFNFVFSHTLRGEKHWSWKGGLKYGYKFGRYDGKRMFEHRKIAEKVLGKPLPIGAVVHHWNGLSEKSKLDIIICQNQRYHLLLHRRERALKACGHADWRICKFCHQYDSVENLCIYEKSRMVFHVKCRKEKRAYDRKRFSANLSRTKNP